MPGALPVWLFWEVHGEGFEEDDLMSGGHLWQEKKRVLLNVLGYLCSQISKREPELKIWWRWSVSEQTLDSREPESISYLLLGCVTRRSVSSIHLLRRSVDVN